MTIAVLSDLGKNQPLVCAASSPCAMMKTMMLTMMMTMMIMTMALMMMKNLQRIVYHTVGLHHTLLCESKDDADYHHVDNDDYDHDSDNVLYTGCFCDWCPPEKYKQVNLG